MSPRPTAERKRPYRMAARAVAAQETRERTARVAWGYFSAKPYEAVRLADIAADAEVTVQTLHTIHGTKDELFVAAWTWFAARQVSPREEAPVGDVRTAVRLLYDSYERDGDGALRVIGQEERIPAIREMADLGRSYHRGWVERTFAPLLAGLSGGRRERRLAALILATDLLAWKVLRREMRLERAVAERTVVELIDATRGAS